MEKSSNPLALAGFKMSVAMHINHGKGFKFTPARYPYTYAADFLRAHQEMVPAWLRDRLDGSRGAASRVRSQWAERMGITDYDAAETLALAYITENDVQDVPLDLINRSAAGSERSDP